MALKIARVKYVTVIDVSGNVYYHLMIAIGLNRIKNNVNSSLAHHVLIADPIPILLILLNQID